MTARPHDLTDLYLAPVLLELDERLETFNELSPKDVELRVTLDTDRQPRHAGDRAALLLESITRAVDTHGWATSWAPRGLRMSHDGHAVVLGIPESLKVYLGG